MKQFSARTGRAAACVMFCLALISGGCSRRAENLDTLGGKWVAAVVWNDASGRPYAEKMRTALFFLPHGVAGIVLTFPTGAVGGTGTYTLNGSRLSVHCGSLSINGRPLPLATFSHAPWYRGTASYTVRYNNGDLVLTLAVPGPTPAPCWPPLVSPKPLVFSRLELPEDPASAPTPPGE